MSEKLKIIRLEQLLQSWGCKTLFDLFKDEEIFIDELEMMKLHHLHELLRSYKMGLRIRFEYHFEKWRRTINKPLESGMLITNKVHESKANTVQIEQQIQESTPKTVPPSQVSDNSQDIHDTSSNSALLLEALTQPSAKTTNLPAQQQTNNQQCSLPLYALANTKEAFYELTPLKILKESGVKGQALLDYYAEYQNITPAQRQLLVRLICVYFDDRDLHMSLKTSYILEQQILELFPNEKIEYYRTENVATGKIYNGLKNMKRRCTSYFPNKHAATNKYKRAKISTHLYTKKQNKNENAVSVRETQQHESSNFEYFTVEESNDSQVKLEYNSE